MYKDRDMSWEGEFPYDALAPAGITPHSNMSEILNSMGYFAQRGLVGDVNHAWSTLGMVKERLFIDFFLYRTEVQPETEEDERG